VSTLTAVDASFSLLHSLSKLLLSLGMASPSVLPQQMQALVEQSLYELDVAEASLETTLGALPQGFQLVDCGKSQSCQGPRLAR
jgi:hypothetical protein